MPVIVQGSSIVWPYNPSIAPKAMAGFGSYLRFHRYYERAFTDRLSQPAGEPSGKHPVDQLCAAQGVAHRLIAPRSPQTNGMVERFNGRITEVLAAVHLRNREELEAALSHYRRLYNHHIPQKALNGQAPVDFLKATYERKPELFKHPVRKQPRPDI